MSVVLLLPLVFVVLFVAVAAAVWLGLSALNQVRQLRTELDQTQRQLNDTQRQLDDTQRQLNDLKAATEVVPAPPPPPLPRARSSGLDDLRQQLRAAHGEDDSEE